MGFLLTDLSLNSSDTVVVVLLWVLIVLGVLLFAGMLFSVITKIYVWATYVKYNKIDCQKKIPALELTRQNLEHCNLPNVTVKQSSWLRNLLGLNMQGYGNSYSSYRKIIYLRKNIAEKSTITSVAVSTQKVGHAVMDNKKEHQFYYKVKPLLPFVPALMIPFMLIAVIIDMATGSGLGIYSFIFALISLIAFSFSFILLLITIPIEKKANQKSVEILKQTAFATEDELLSIQKVQKAYILSYVADFIYAILQLIWDIIRILLKALQKKK